MAGNDLDFKRVGDVFVTHDLKRHYAVQSYNAKTGSVTLYRSDSHGNPWGPAPFTRKCEPHEVWTFVMGPSVHAIRREMRRSKR